MVFDQETVERKFSENLVRIVRKRRYYIFFLALLDTVLLLTISHQSSARKPSKPVRKERPSQYELSRWVPVVKDIMEVRNVSLVTCLLSGNFLFSSV